MAWSASSSALICLLVFIFYSSFGQQPLGVHGNVHSGSGGQRTRHMENVALRGTCHQSTKHSNRETVLVGHSCTKAINNDTTGSYLEDGNCIHTAANDDNPFWELKLEHCYKIQSITVYARSNLDYNLYRMAGVSVEIDNKAVYEFKGKGAAVNTISASTQEPNFEELPMMGKTVRLSKTEDIMRTGTDNEKLINFCEVQVWVCVRDYYGSDCSVKCSDGCLDDENKALQNRICNSASGDCIKGCRSGYYGQKCDEHCGHCLAGNCERNGSCNGKCQEGWAGTFCKECKIGRYGQSCSKECGQCSGSGACNRISGECPQGCKEGWNGSLCTDAPSAGVTEAADFISGATSAMPIGLKAYLLAKGKCNSSRHNDSQVIEEESEEDLFKQYLRAEIKKSNAMLDMMKDREIREKEKHEMSREREMREKEKHEMDKEREMREKEKHEMEKQKYMREAEESKARIELHGITYLLQPIALARA